MGSYKAKLKKNGKPHYGICVDPKTGNEFNITISNGEIIKISDFALEEPIYYDLYPLLSGFVHPDITHDVLKSMGTRTVESSNAGDPVLAIILIVFVSILLLLEAANSTFLRRHTKRDLKHVAKTLSKMLISMITSDTVVRRMSVPQSIYNLFGLEIRVADVGGNPGQQ